ncbi:MAG TPA: zinc ribbon domain-containing protein [Oscillospiraceae bacterium]|nr:zinc ribbon domain-containing protein [Oscillospiraceae bacterium]HRW56227.1 zinc ribbon domain-containing protein [Oscillospiraceae bacterium]
MIYCRYCGKMLPDDSVFCEGCGRQLKDNLPEAENGAVSPPAVGVPAEECGEQGRAVPAAGTPPEKDLRRNEDVSAEPEIISCPNCGARFAPGDKEVCPFCGTELPTKEDREEKGRLLNTVRGIYKLSATNAFLIGLLLLIGFLFFFFYLRSDRYETFFSFSSYGMWMIVLFAVAVPFSLIAARRNFTSRIKKAGLTQQQYASLLKESMRRPRKFVPKTPGESAPNGSGAKNVPGKTEKIAGRVLKVTMAALFVGLGLMAANYFTDGAVFSFVDSTVFSSGGESLTGRWEATSRGSYDPAVIFKNGKAYFGIIGLSDEDIIADVAGIRQKADRDGVSYTATATSITFTSNNGISKTYERDKDTIYFGSATLKKTSG